MLNKKSSILSISLALVLVAYFSFQLPSLKFDYDLESFFAKDNDDFNYYQQVVKEFGQDNDNILISVRPEKSLFDSTFVNTVNRFEEELSAMDGTKSTTSPISLKKPVKTPMGYLQLPYLHIDDPAKLKKDSIAISKDAYFRSMFFSKDFTQLKIILWHETFESKSASDEYAAKLKNLINSYSFSEAHLSGKILAQAAFISALEKDFSRFLVLSLILVIIMLVVFIRNPVLIVVSLIILLMALAATLGIMVVTGKKIDVLSTLIPSIILVVSMSDVIHLFSQTRNELAKGMEPLNAINLAVQKIGWATFLTSVTTAIGFLTLTTLKVRPVVDLGLYSAAGIAVAFLLTYLVFPQVLIFLHPKTLERQSRKRIVSLMEWLFLWVSKSGLKIILISLATAVFMVIGINQLKIESYLVDDLPNGDPVKDDFEYFNENYAGARPFTMTLWPKDSTRSLFEKDVLIEMDQIQGYAASILQVGDIVSPLTVVKTLHQSLHSGNPKYFTLPESDAHWKTVLYEIEKRDIHIKSPVASGNLGLISGFVYDEGSIHSSNKRKTFEAAVTREVNPQLVDCRVTGTSYLVEQSHEYLSRNLITGLLIALVIVGLVAGLMFRSVKMILITLIPNLFPIMAVAAIMGFLNIPINLGSSVMFAISFGIAVDDTIHFLSKFLLEKKQHRSNLYAIRRTMVTSGEPILITTLVLTAGFVVFSFSQFNASFYIGLFVSVSFVVALIADLTLLPALLLRFYSDKKKK